MAQPRERIKVEDKYLHELGRATYNFAYLEWGIVWLTETIERGFLKKAAKLTAGQIATAFDKAVSKLPNGDADKKALSQLADDFSILVEDRNRLIHGNPFTADKGQQRLFYAGKHGRKDWTIDLIQEFSDELIEASTVAGELLHSGKYAEWQKGPNK